MGNAIDSGSDEGIVNLGGISAREIAPPMGRNTLLWSRYFLIISSYV
ncbi:hypothetical protein NIES2104_38920 [Leptolyngbya sp. NIES-2104]|nr:hypothetical protein NIES2104_38920 [Leptolyngbya sp. NIES-2104]